MKRLLLTMLLLPLLCSCDEVKKTLEVQDECASMTDNNWCYIDEFSYKGHDYIKFAKSYEGAAVHNPECKHPLCVKLRNMIENGRD